MFLVTIARNKLGSQFSFVRESGESPREHAPKG